jgi:hypothetical protein
MANFRTIGTNFNGGLRAPHYPNGRLLTAEDLQQEQQTQLEKLAQLGQAAGYGIVEGFNVSAAANNSALKVTAGLGLNPKGNLIHLPADSVTLPIQPIAGDDTTIRRSARFEACDGDEEQPPTLTTGAYLLTAAPLAQLEGAVPRKACDGTGTSTCANQWEVEGVEFKIIRLTQYTPPTGSRANRNRNLLAHWFYGSDKIMNLMRDPLKFPADYSGFNQIAAEDFSQCDLPLAVFYWASSKIAFIDEWAVRRRLIHPYPASQGDATKWTANLSDQRQAEGQARFLQFQDHIADLQTQFGSKTDTIQAVDRFAYLPPVGVLPVNPFELIVADVFDESVSEKQLREMEAKGLSKEEVLEQVRTGVLGSLGSDNAFNLERFFGDLLSDKYSIVHEDFVHDRLHQSWVQPPILLPPPPSVESYFQFTLANGTLVAVNDSNFDVVLSNIHKNFSGSVYKANVSKVAGAVSGTAANISAASPTRRVSAALRGTAETVPGETAAANNPFVTQANFGLYNQNFTFRPPKEIFNPTYDDDEEIEPLIDIMVVDELLDPYRSQLGKEMTGRIDDAIAILSGAGGIFTGSNRFTAFNNSIANAFTLNTFMWQAANFGIANFGGLLQLIGKSNPPVFYVVFARHRPAIIRRPLRL